MQIIRKLVRSFPSSRLLLTRYLLAGTLLIVVLSLAVGVRQIRAPYPSPPTVLTNDRVQTEVACVGQQYMKALLHQQYETMWSLLHPQVQAMWPDKEAFAHYWQVRFRGYTLQSFSSGKVSHLSWWINPETMARYQDVEVMPLSLELKSQLPPQQQALLAPPFQHPSQLFQNLPFIVQRIPTRSTGETDHWLILSGGPADLEAPLLPPVTPTDKTVKVPILMYHYISDVPANDPNPSLRRSLSVSPPLFNGQLDYLKQQGYHSITFNQLMNALYYGAPLPAKPIILTFDDGYIDGYTAAYPALKAHGFSGMFYIITGKVGWNGQVTWDQLREMLANGMQMGSHTVHHVDMGKTYRNSPEQARQEVLVSQIELQRHLGIIIQHFCYPYGAPFKGVDFSLQQQIASLLATNGYLDATTDPGPTGTTQRSLAPFALLRLRIDGRSSLPFFVRTLLNTLG